ncbi:Peptidase M28 [Penicillium macrosclerotiorum]|uniref:Peptidase M28 n=1 Tax=Penicillium macrosclerotiorum TaxID=303699 RepID=UPI002549496F|nr:Peptidase M28 [Penicillium macrosclerotiorum]KAJ5689946.1 Peptidase M28 [Penicillium macrosclerotiorum]
MKWFNLVCHISIALAGHLNPPVSTVDFPSMIKLEDLLEGSRQLENFAYSYPERNRVFGSAAHNDTVDFIYRELKKSGYYHVWKQPQVHTWTKSESSLIFNDDSIEVAAMTYSPSVDVTAEIAVILNSGCSVADYPNDVAGRIALVKRGECTFADKSLLAASANAAAVLVFNNVAGSLSGTLGAVSSDNGSFSAIAGISKADGEILLDAAEKNTVVVALEIDSQIENRTTFNVIAETKGGDHNNVVVLGGHTDSVEAGPGINDDGSGIISNLVVARALTKFSVKNAVRFCFWTAEEFGLLGSEFYTAQLDSKALAKIRLYLNFDMIASPNYALMIYDGDGDAFNQTGPDGSAQIEALFQEYFTSINLPYIPTAFDGRSDYDGFISRGIPAGGLFTGAEGIKTDDEAKLFGGQANISYDINYHAAGDDFANLNHDAFLINSKATAFAIATYANSLASIPPRTQTSTKREWMRRELVSHIHSKNTGCFHFHVLR